MKRIVQTPTFSPNGGYHSAAQRSVVLNSITSTTSGSSFRHNSYHLKSAPVSTEAISPSGPTNTAASFSGSNYVQLVFGTPLVSPIPVSLLSPSSFFNSPSPHSLSASPTPQVLPIRKSQAPTQSPSPNFSAYLPLPIVNPTSTNTKHKLRTLVTHLYLYETPLCGRAAPNNSWTENFRDNPPPQSCACTCAKLLSAGEPHLVLVLVRNFSSKQIPARFAKTAMTY